MPACHSDLFSEFASIYAKAPFVELIIGELMTGAHFKLFSVILIGLITELVMSH